MIPFAGGIEKSQTNRSGEQNGSCQGWDEWGSGVVVRWV